MPPPQTNNNKGLFGGLGFFGMVGLVMGALKLKEHWDARYKPVSTAEDGADEAPPYRDHEDPEAVSLLNTELPMRRSSRRTKKGCCVCCGIDCGLFWKAFGIVCGLLVLWGIFKGVRWAVTPSPTGLEGIPEFSSALGCQSGRYFYNGTKEFTYDVPVLAEEPYHSFALSGNGVGTLLLAEGETGQTDIRYKMSIRSEQEDVFQGIKLDHRSADFSLYTSNTDSQSTSCVRFDVTMYIPRSLKKLVVKTRSSTHIKFEPNAKVSLQSLSISSNFQGDTKSMIITSSNFKSDRISLDAYRGWITGDILLVNTTVISTQNGDAVANVHIHPAAPSNPELPEAAVLDTVSGAGRMDIFYKSEKGYQHRPIDSTHRGSRKGEIYLDYKDSEFSGLIEVKSPSMWATGMQLLVPKVDKWTHFVGDQNGVDRLSATSTASSFNIKF